VGEKSNSKGYASHSSILRICATLTKAKGRPSAKEKTLTSKRKERKQAEKGSRRIRKENASPSGAGNEPALVCPSEGEGKKPHEDSWKQIGKPSGEKEGLEGEIRLEGLFSFAQQQGPK